MIIKPNNDKVSKSGDTISGNLNILKPIVFKTGSSNIFTVYDSNLQYKKFISFGINNITSDKSCYLPDEDGIIATREWVNNKYARFASNKDTSVPAGSWTAGASTTVTVAGTYMVIGSALFNNTNGNQAISVSVGNYTYYQTFYSYSYSQSNTLTLMLIAGISANTVIKTNIWSGVARTVNNNIVAIRIV